MQFKTIHSFPNYEVSRTGIVRNKYTKHILSQWLHNGMYLRVTLRQNGRRKNYRVHRLIAQAFLPNPHERKEVNHKNFCGFDNALSNLEWVTPTQNKAYTTNMLRKAKRKK